MFNAITQPSAGATTAASGGVPSETTQSVTSEPNADESFNNLVWLTYELYLAISGWMDFVNKSLQKQVTDFRLRN